MEIRKVAVIGAGVMGAGIAAHVANAGVPVVLLDIVPDGATDRDVIARSAIERLRRTEPAAFMHRRNARLVTPGNVEDHLDWLADCDWIVEAVIERLDVKRDLYARIDAVRRPGCVVSSNTSTIPLADLVAGRGPAFAADFLITHFFNPPRYMRLLEVVSAPATRAEVVAGITDFADRRLGKGVVHCHDRPGFIANRIGTYWIQTAMLGAMKAGLTVEEADAIVGPPMGVPKTGVFGLMDLVGIDLMPHVLASLQSNLPPEDPLARSAGVPLLVSRMVEDGYTGRKGKGGFYRLRRADGQRIKEAIDLASGEYRASVRARPECVAAARAGDLAALTGHDSPGGRYAWTVLSRTLAYAAALVPEIADSPAAIDAAMRLGYSWRYGPFELIDRLGVDRLADGLAAQGEALPALLEKARGRTFYREHEGLRECLGVDGAYHPVPRPEGVLVLADIKRQGPPLARNASASLWDVGDGVLCLEFHTKSNSLDPGVLAMIQRALELVPSRGKALVIHNDADNFSVGANIGLLLFGANMAAWEQIDGMVAQGQRTLQALRYAPFPVVAAPSGMALGGGCEILLHCAAVQAHAETYTGLVEAGVGLVPGWGGCKELLARWLAYPRRPGGPMPAVAKVFELISTAHVARSAEEARDMLVLAADDGITMNRDRLLADAKARALALAADYVPPEPVTFHLPGPTARLAMEMAVTGFRKLGKATAHDAVVAGELAGVLSGGAVDMLDELSEQGLYDLERAALLALARTPGTLARVEHMLETGKPLRN